VSARTVDLERGALVISRAELVTLADGGALPFSDEERAQLSRHAAVVAGATCHVTVTRVRPGELQRVDVWLSRDGLVAQPRQLAADEPTAVIGTSPAGAYAALARVLALRSDLGTAPVACPPWSLGELVQGVVDDLDVAPAMGASVVVLDWRFAGAPRSVRWVVFESNAGRWADLRDDPAHVFELQLAPASALKVFAASAAVVGGILGDAR
jgi:hypothetical protein